MNPNLLEPIPASRLRRDLRKVLRRLDRGEGPFRITQRSGPDLALMRISDLDRLLDTAGVGPEVEDVPSP